MAMRLGRHAGNLSYGIYLWHALVLDALLANTELSRWSLLGVCLLITWLLAELSWRGVEQPLLRRWRRQATGAGTT